MAITTVETCPLCGTDDIRVDDAAWFSIEFERRTEVSDDEGEVQDAVAFTCRECGVNWG